MSNRLYSQDTPYKPSNRYSATRSAIDNTTTTTTTTTTPSSRITSSSRYIPTSSSLHEASRLSLSSDPRPLSSLYSCYSDRAYRSSGDTAAATSAVLWPSFNVSSALIKRPAEALYNYSPLGVPMLGQSEAWLTSDMLAKRPRLESAHSLPVYPQRPGEKDCAHYMLTRTCKFGDSCKFDHPIWVPDGGIPDWKEMLLPPIVSDSHPERSGAPDCPYFLKTQKCKFGLNCKFNHPKEQLGNSDKTDAVELPERLSEPVCSFYAKTGKCKFGATCKFHHPKDIQIPSDGQEYSIKDPHSLAEDVNYTNGANGVKIFITDPASSYNSKGLPIRPAEEDCPFYMKTGSCKYAANCRYNHPDRNAINPPVALAPQSVFTSPLPNLGVGLINPAASILPNFQPSLAQTTFAPARVVYPQRPGQSECEFYMKTGVCKFEERCRFHHPIDRPASAQKQMQEQNVKLTLAGLPRREGVSHCPFYMKTGMCKYGATCKFDHPPPGEVMASGKDNSATGEEMNEKEEFETAEE